MESFTVPSMIGGFHVYKDVWNPKINELKCWREEINPYDSFTVVALRLNDNMVVGHFPKKSFLPAPYSFAGVGRFSV